MGLVRMRIEMICTFYKVFIIMTLQNRAWQKNIQSKKKQEYTNLRILLTFPQNVNQTQIFNIV